MILLENRKARHDYQIEDELVAGVQLTGPEVKSLRHKSGSLNGSYVRLVGGEAYLLGAQISPYQFADNRDYDPKRSRKLLLQKKELAQLETLQQQRRELVPLQFFLTGRRIKLKLGIGRGLKQYEKRQKLKEKAQVRDARRELRYEA